MEYIWSFIESLKQFWMQYQENIPKYITALFLVILGWIIARVVEKIAIRIFRVIKLEEISERAGIEDFLYRGGVKFTTSKLLAKLIYWFLIFSFTLTILNSIGMTAASELLNRMIMYVPNVIIAFIVLLFGNLFANFAYTATVAYLNNIGISGAEMLSILVKYAILLFVLSMALEQLNIGGQILVSAFQIAFGAFCLALALAFGLGGKEWASKILEQLWNKK